MNTLVRKAAKVATLPLGVMRRAGAGDIVILLYHRVGAGTREIDIDSSAFESHLQYLADQGVVRTLDQALAQGGVVISVDDGYSDFADNVVPLLVRYGIPGTLYLATGLVANATTDPDTLTWATLSDAVATGLIAVGSHTHNHADLSKSNGVDARDEMLRSKELIEDRLGVPCRHFAFPWGVASPQAVEAGHALFDTSALGWATNRRQQLDPHRLGRTPVLRSDGAWFFRAKVRAQLDGEALAYRILRRGPWRRT